MRMIGRSLGLTLLLQAFLLLSVPDLSAQQDEASRKDTSSRRQFDFSAPDPSQILPNPPATQRPRPYLRAFGPVGRVGPPSSNYGSQDINGQYSEVGGTGGNGGGGSNTSPEPQRPAPPVSTAVPTPANPPASTETPRPLTTTFLVIAMEWHERCDIDLYITDPMGNEFYYAKKNTTGQDFRNSQGQLHLDMIQGPGMELWQNPSAEPGEYRVSYGSLCSLPVEVGGWVIDRSAGKQTLPVKTVAPRTRVEIATITVTPDGSIVIRPPPH
jgi:hypothetical protein